MRKIAPAARVIILVTQSPFFFANGFLLGPKFSRIQQPLCNGFHPVVKKQQHRDGVCLKTASADTCSLDSDDFTDCLVGVGYEPLESAAVNEVYVAKLERLQDHFPSHSATNVIRYDRAARRSRSHKLQQQQHKQQRRAPREEEEMSSSRVDMEYNEFVSEEELVLVDIVRKAGMKRVSRAFHRAGPRQRLHFDPSSVNAAIVTCGGLCPGLNNVIRELVHSLYYLYDVNQVYGITGGFHGFYRPEYEPVLLTNELVENIHHEGGTVLRSSRGGFDIEKILQFLKDKEIQQLYIIGGDGTHRGAYAIHQACKDSGMNVAVAGIPKTIDNDVDFIDRSFGFSSAVEAAQAGIHTAKTEAMCNVPNGIGIIKLMGRSAGFLAAFAALGSGDVDLVLIPEVPIVLEGPNGIMPYLRKRVQEHKFAVVVVAEGAGEEILGVSTELDAGGNRSRPKIGEFLTKTIAAYFKSFDETATIKYIDPSYMVRSVPANAADSLYCTQLAQNAVHGAMFGYTGFSVGLVNNAVVYLPIPQLVASSPRTMNPHGSTWGRIIAMTGQPNTALPKVTTEEDQLSLPEPTFP